MLIKAGKMTIQEPCDARIYFQRARSLDTLDTMLERVAERNNITHLTAVTADNIEGLKKAPFLKEVGYLLEAYRNREQELKL